MQLIIGLFFIFFSLTLWSAPQPSEADLKKLKQDIQSAQQRINKSHGEENKLENNLRQTEIKLGTIESDVFKLKKDIAATQIQLNALNDDSKQLIVNKKQQEEQIIAQINASYRMGRESKIKILLNQEDPQKLSRSLVYADYFNRAHIESIEEYRATLDKIEQNKLSIETKSHELLTSKDALIKNQKILQASYQLRSQSLVELKKTIKTDKDQLKKLELDHAQLESLLRSVSVAIENIKLPSDSLPFKKTKGKLNWPTTGERKNRFGKIRSPGNLRWQGISFYANSGKEVRAVHHGRVIFADWFRGKGLLMIIDHGDGYMTLYAHNQSLLRETGDWVSAGETIAGVGNSGGLDHSELYFEIRHQGQPLNPIYWLKQKG